MFKKGDKVISREVGSWTDGLVGKVVNDPRRGHNCDVLVEFNEKEAATKGHDAERKLSARQKQNRWFIDAFEVSLYEEPKGTITIGTPTLADDLRLTPQSRKILAHLLQGKSISPSESERVYQIYRLSDCVLKIRRAGYNVETEMSVDETGHKYGRYKLAA